MGGGGGLEKNPCNLSQIPLQQDKISQLLFISKSKKLPPNRKFPGKGLANFPPFFFQAWLGWY